MNLLVPGTWYQYQYQYQVPGARCQVPGARYHTWYRYWYQVPLVARIWPIAEIHLSSQ